MTQKKSDQRKAVPATEMLRLLNEGGWRIVGGRETHELPLSVGCDVSLARLDGEQLVLGTDPVVCRFALPADGAYRLNPWTIEVRKTYPTEQMRKAAMGGGTHVVQVPATALTLVHQSIKLHEHVQRRVNERLADAARFNLEENLRDQRLVALQVDLDEQLGGQIIESVLVKDDGTVELTTDQDDVIVFGTHRTDRGGVAKINGVELEGFHQVGDSEDV